MIVKMEVLKIHLFQKYINPLIRCTDKIIKNEKIKTNFTTNKTCKITQTLILLSTKWKNCLNLFTGFVN